MKYILIALFFSGICWAPASFKRAVGHDEYHDILKKFQYSLKQSDRPVAKEGGNGSLISTVIFIDLPTLSDSIDLGDLDDKTEKFSIHYEKVKFSSLSSAYALSYRIDVDSNMVQTVLALGKAQLKGLYSILNSSPSVVAQSFEVNLYAHIMFLQNTAYEVRHGEVIPGETNYYKLLFDKAKCKYANPNSFEAALTEYVVSPKLLDAVSQKIHVELSQKLFSDNIRQHIQREIMYKESRDIADRLMKAIEDSFTDVHYNKFSVFFTDKMNFHQSIDLFDVRIPNYILRRVEGFVLIDVSPSFLGDEVYVKANFIIPSPLAVPTVIYRRKMDPHAQNLTINPHYLVGDLLYEFEFIAKKSTSQIYLSDILVSAPSVKVSPTQAPFKNETDVIVNRLTKYLPSYIMHNNQYAIKIYTNGLIAEGRMAHKVFKA